MADTSSEQDKSEQATPFKLDKARQRGVLARGTDLGFLSVLVAFAIVSQLSGAGVTATTAAMMRQSLAAIGHGNDTALLGSLIRRMSISVASDLIIPALLLVSLVMVVEIVQNRGIVFSATPLKPDFSRLNPAKGLKRLFSMRLLKELLKSLVKITAYSMTAYFLIKGVATSPVADALNARGLAEKLIHFSGRLLLAFILVAAGIAVLDQLLARREFAKQMRMSRRDVTRESREREGEPRQKRKRRQIMTELIKQASAAGTVKGADLLIVNPVHFAVALRYRPDDDVAPMIVAVGRNAWARRMKEAAYRWNITVVRQPGLARDIYRTAKAGGPIRPEHYVAVADLYIMMRRRSEAQAGAAQSDDV